MEAQTVVIWEGVVADWMDVSSSVDLVAESKVYE